MKLDATRIDSPLGPILLVGRDGRLCGLNFADRWAALEGWLGRRFGKLELARGGGLRDAEQRLRAYFDGDLDAVDAIEVDTGGTPFQRQVWHALRAVPPGDTATYGGLARAIGRPRAVRAVGGANGANPVSIVLPCHRVIGGGGRLTGYGGGLPRKRWLLQHEGVEVGA